MEVDRWGESPFEEPVKLLAAGDPAEIAARSGSTWEGDSGEGGRLVVPVLKGTVSVGFPEISVQPEGDLDSFVLKLLTLLYLVRSNGVPPSGEWVPFRELAGGRFYEPVVRRSIEEPLAARFSGATEELAKAAAIHGGAGEEFGDASFSFNLFPYVRICFLFWDADGEFPARAGVLFDSSCTNHLTAFDLRMGAQELAGRLLRG